MRKALEGKRSTQLNLSGRSVRSQKGSIHTRWRVQRALDSSIKRACDIAHRLVEIRVVQDVEELSAEAQGAVLPSRQFEVLHHRKIRIEVVGSVDLVSSLVAPIADGRSRSIERDGGIRA